ncbi:transcription factor domain-containing protein [Aspergillus mulundensis]|uniref:Xylanolytic transcriptional activator regulatory domain-containing protein n=1 Tax=Aspergillus mulundensis TaxID=1810919 RepID=A0A3D8QAS1_9EURO|nr:hypothetical protein DSM5745_11149 [Aspergillus mulundensis]RDW58943.1 hypothetical protein DSM5745_11149 [Aspergillus mulundensis]
MRVPRIVEMAFDMRKDPVGPLQHSTLTLCNAGFLGVPLRTTNTPQAVIGHKVPLPNIRLRDTVNVFVLALAAGEVRRQPGKEEPAYSKLFWCLWSLDKLLASMFGRPCHLRDDDISLERPSSVLSSHREPRTPFDIWLTLLEIVFHRLVEAPRSEPNNMAHIQRGLAAIRIQSIVATECQRALPPLSIIPYAISPAVTVFYQQYRPTKLITQQTRLAADLEACCSLLEEQRIWWYSAEKPTGATADLLDHAAGDLRSQPSGYCRTDTLCQARGFGEGSAVDEFTEQARAAVCGCNGTV